MGDSFSRIDDEIEDYKRRCEKYGEAVQYSHGSPDCFGTHAKVLEEREQNDQKSTRSTFIVVFSGGDKNKLAVAEIQDNMRYEMSDYKRASRQEFDTRTEAVQYAKHLAKVHHINFEGDGGEDDFLD